MCTFSNHHPNYFKLNTEYITLTTSVEKFIASYTVIAVLC